jgi:hypothetical protein
MSTGRRAYNLLRGYIGREWDRIKSWERLDALTELDDKIDAPPGEKAASEEDAPEKTVVYIPEGSTREQAAAHILGVSEKASFQEIRFAFVKLSKRSDPSNFTSGTPEHTQARDIYKKVHWAYRTLTEEMSDSDKRFGSLEIE